MPTLRPSNPKRLLRLIIFSVTPAAATAIGDNTFMREIVDKAPPNYLRNFCEAFHYSENLAFFGSSNKLNPANIVTEGVKHF